MKRVLLGFSGGMDSCMAAERLLAVGHAVTAVTLDLTGDAQVLAHACAQARLLGIDWFADDVRSRFERDVVSYFVDSYVRGQTPAPCTVCNTAIKWRRLAELADQLGMDHIATGHYFKTVFHNGRFYVARGADAVKDQSYYLWGLDGHLLAKVLTPMGEVIKDNFVMDLPRQARQRESMGVCFLGGRPYGDFLCERGIFPSHGEVVDLSGAVVAGHKGYQLYTIGQKRWFSEPGGREFSSPLPKGMAVIRIDAAQNRLHAGGVDDLMRYSFVVAGHNLNMDEWGGCPSLNVKIRGLGRNPEGFVRLREVAGGVLEVTLRDAAFAPAPGQPVVFYYGEMVVGGGFII